MTDRIEYLSTKIYELLSMNHKRNKTEEKIYNFLDSDNCYIIYYYRSGVVGFEPICNSYIPLYFKKWVLSWCNKNGYKINKEYQKFLGF